MRGLVVAAALAAPRLATGQACAPDTPPPAGYELWRSAAVAADSGVAAQDAPALAIGRLTRLELHPAASVRFVAAPEQQRKVDAPQAGLAVIEVPRRGVYRVTASAPAWFDMLAGQERLRNEAYGRVGPCGPVRMFVEFRMEPGRHVLQLSGATDTHITVAVEARPRN
ncbi:MAG: hypothetical protein RQ833_02195 [Sphingomonadaceae bacterium]|nr:hypothetical protein [Sphingomonadaceae bacterium]